MKSKKIKSKTGASWRKSIRVFVRNAALIYKELKSFMFL